MEKRNICRISNELELKVWQKSKWSAWDFSDKFKRTFWGHPVQKVFAIGQQGFGNHVIGTHAKVATMFSVSFFTSDATNPTPWPPLSPPCTFHWWLHISEEGSCSLRCFDILICVHEIYHILRWIFLNICLYVRKVCLYFWRSQVFRTVIP